MADRTFLEPSFLALSHDEKIFSRFDRMVSLRDGRIEATGYPPGGRRLSEQADSTS
jgi:hypothetical protein